MPSMAAGKPKQAASGAVRLESWSALCVCSSGRLDIGRSGNCWRVAIHGGVDTSNGSEEIGDIQHVCFACIVAFNSAQKQKAAGHQDNAGRGAMDAKRCGSCAAVL